MEQFEYPKVLLKSSEMYKTAKCIGNDSEIFGGRKKLMQKHFEECPIYLDESYYAQCDKLPMVEKNEEDFTGGVYNKLSSWRDCHYYRHMDYNGHQFYILTGGRYD